MKQKLVGIEEPLGFESQAQKTALTDGFPSLW